MAGRRYRRGRSGYRRRDAGLERALQHIEEARQLSRELGGSDQDVKRYFFSLSPSQLHDILDAYERKYGHEARAYAEQTLPRWHSGKVTMSGMVASRLFNLLPPRMPLPEKYALTENLWRHVGPSSKKLLRVGLDADIEAVVTAVRDHIDQVVINYKIPENLEQRFVWLSAGDVNVKQQLLNHLRQTEKSLVVDGAREKLPVMLDHLRGDNAHHTRRLAEILKVGKHELEVVLDRASSGVKLEQPSVAANVYRMVPSAGSKAWLVWVVIGIAVLLFLMLHR